MTLGFRGFEIILKEGIYKMKIWNRSVFNDPQIKTAHSKYRDQAIKIIIKRQFIIHLFLYLTNKTH